MLPGFVLGGSSIAAFFKLSDGKFEPLTALCLACSVWATTAYISSRTAFFARRVSQIYYPAAAITAALFTLPAGGIAVYCGNGTVAACAGIVVSAIAAAWFAHSFVSPNCTIFDRCSFIAGSISSAVIWFYAAVFSRLAWMETLFFYAAIALLTAWAFASPLTRYGSRRKKRCWRLVLLLAAIGSFYTVPVFSPPPAVELTQTGKMWTKTHTTANGRRFILQEESGSFGYYTPQGRLLAAGKANENLRQAVLALISLPEDDISEIRLFAPATSVLPKFLKAHTRAKITYQLVPESIMPRKFKWNNTAFSQMLPNQPTVKLRSGAADIVLITELPENSYPEFLQYWLEYAAVMPLHYKGIAALPAYLLKNPTVFKFMHENFSHSGVLPGSGELWVFSNHKLDLSLKSISERMQDKLNHFPGLNSAMFEIIYSNKDWGEKHPETGNPPALKLGGNLFCGSWWWLLAGAAAAILWRVIRLFGERRNIMYSYFNAIENGFSGMGVFLLSLALLLIHNGAYTLFLAIAAISFAFFYLKYKFLGVWAAAAGALILLIVFFNHGAYNFLLVLIMLQAIALTGAMPSINPTDVHAERQLLNAVFMGMMFAAWLISAVWLFNIPLLPVWGLFLLARLPGIWQYSRKGVYYNNVKQ